MNTTATNCFTSLVSAELSHSSGFVFALAALFVALSLFASAIGNLNNDRARARREKAGLRLGARAIILLEHISADIQTQNDYMLHDDSDSDTDSNGSSTHIPSRSREASPTAATHDGVFGSEHSPVSNETDTSLPVSPVAPSSPSVTRRVRRRTSAAIAPARLDFPS